MRGRILLIGHEAGREWIKPDLETEGYRIDPVAAATEAIPRIHDRSYDLAIAVADALVCPGGAEFLRQLRRHTELPLLCLCARDSDAAEVRRLELQEESCLREPFDQAELRERVRSILCWHRRLSRNRSAAAAHIRRAGPLRLDLLQDRVWLGEAEVVLTAREFDLLRLLSQHPNRAVAKAEILGSLWGDTQSTGEHLLHETIRRLRTKIEPDPSAPTLIRTVWGVGYLLAVE